MAWAKMIAAFAFILLAVVMAYVVRAGPPRAPRAPRTGGAAAVPAAPAAPGASAGPDYPRTFVISGGQEFDFARLRALMRARGWAERTADAALADGAAGLVWVMVNDDGRFDGRLYTLRCRAKSLLARKRAITDKWLMWAALTRAAPDLARAHLAESWDLAACAAPPAPGPLIIRPANLGSLSAKGRNIWRVADAAGFAAAKRALAQTRPVPDEDGKRQPLRALVSRYVLHPLLFPAPAGGLKFHVRIYLLVRAGPAGARRAAVFDRGRIFTAAEPYRAADVGVAAVHDTHGQTTPEALYFPEDYPGDAAAFLAQARAVLLALAAQLEPQPPSEAAAAYEVFAADVLPDAAPATPGPVPRAVLLELNDHVGYHYRVPTAAGAARWADFCAAYTDWVDREALAALLD